MWSSNAITIEIDEAERSEVMIAIDTPAGGLTILGNLKLAAGVLTIDRAHIQGLAPGALGRAGLNAIGYRILEETGAKALVIQGSSRTTGRNPGRAPLAIRFPRQTDSLGRRDG